MERIAVLGAGALGTCLALELARRDREVDVYEMDAQPISRAGAKNEGKIHQGFIYAKNDPTRTARLMAHGALEFRRSLARWVDVESCLVLSTPFLYAVRKGSMLGVEELRRHYDRCRANFAELSASSEGDYLGRECAATFEEVDRDELASELNPDAFLTAFRTSELAVDPRAVAAALREAFAADEKIHGFFGAGVEHVEERSDGSFVVHVEGDGSPRAPYDQVVNCLWHDLLRIDRTVGLEPPRTWSFRHKFGSRVRHSLLPADLPSVTVVLGPYGDLVNFGGRGFFLSWYPEGMVDMTSELAPPRGWTDWSRERRLEVFWRSHERWLDLCPKLGDLDFPDDSVDPVSGVIFAWGDTDIDDEDSGLHSRFEVGIRSHGGFHSINTGKYTLAPWMALRAADRVTGAVASRG